MSCILVNHLRIQEIGGFQTLKLVLLSLKVTIFMLTLLLNNYLLYVIDLYSFKLGYVQSHHLSLDILCVMRS